MAQFVSYHPDVETPGEGILSFVNSMTKGQDFRNAFLAKHGLFPEPGKWYSLQKWLDTLKDIAESIGETNLLLVGITCIDKIEMPPIKDLRECLSSLDIGYHLNHRLHGKPMFDMATGQMTEGIGHSFLTDYDEKARKAIMTISTPFPDKIDEGALISFVRKFKPADSVKQEVKIDVTKERRSHGADSSTFIITW